MKETKIQWHSAFVSAMGLDLEKNRADLIFEKEYNLNTKPKGLFRYFKEHGCEIVKFSSGIYYIEGKAWFPTQIIVTGELDEDSHVWLKALSGNLQREDFRKILDKRSQLEGKENRELADSVLEVSISANKDMIDELIGDESMYETLMEIMEPKLKARDEKIRINEAVSTLRDIGYGDDKISPAIIKKYHLSAEEAENYLQNA